jgi:hypothetical protein
MLYIVILLQLNDIMRGVIAGLILIILTAQTSSARILSQQQFLRELTDYGVPGNDLPTCEFNS